MKLTRRDCFRLAGAGAIAAAVPFTLLGTPLNGAQPFSLSLMRTIFNNACSGTKLPKAMLLGDAAFIEFYDAVSPYHWVAHTRNGDYFMFRGVPVLSDSSVGRWHIEALREWPDRWPAEVLA